MRHMYEEDYEHPDMCQCDACQSHRERALLRACCKTCRCYPCKCGEPVNPMFTYAANTTMICSICGKEVFKRKDGEVICVVCAREIAIDNAWDALPF